MKPVSAASVPVVTVDLDEPAATRWIAPGRKISGLVNRLTDSVMAALREGLPGYLQPLLTKKSALLSWLGYLPARALSSRLMDEARGLSRATGVPAPLLALANCVYDVSQFADRSEPSACSAAVYQHKHGHPVMIRYMDWAFPEDIGRYTVRVDYVRDGVPAYSALGFAGFLGVVTAMAPGWAFAFNQAPAANVDKSILGLPSTYAARMVCDDARTFRDILRGVIRAKPLSPFLALVCGTEPGEIARIERPNRRVATHAKSDPDKILGLANHYIHRNHRKWNSETEWTDEDGQEWVIDTVDRLAWIEHLARAFRRNRVLPTFANMRVRPVFNSCTVHMAIMCPAQGTAKFSNRKPRK